MGRQAGRAERYEIQIVGHLAPRWAAFFDGMTVTARHDGTTVIQGPIVDQAALHGLIRKLSDLGLPLVSVKPAVDDDSPPAAPIPADRPPAPPTTREGARNDHHE